MAACKRLKLHVRSFQESWTTDFGFVSRDDRAVCAFCCQNIVCWTSSIKRHFETKHEKSFKDDAEKIESLKKAVSRYEKQSSIFKKVISGANRTTESSYKAAECIAQHGKPFTDGVFIKEAFLSCADVLFDDLPNKNTIISRIQDMPVSARTIERRITDIAKDVNKQQTIALKTANVFSVALDESIDINDNPRLAVVARYCCDGEVHEELCCLKPIYGTTTGKDILDTFTKHFEERGIDMKKIFSVTTDGAPAMIGQHRGFVNLFEQKIRHPVMKLHCIVHQENLCEKISNSALNDVMSTVTKIVNFLVPRSATTHRQFRSLLEEMESSYRDLHLHCSVRWLSRGKVLLRFVECLVEIKVFLIGQGKAYPELEEENWLVKLMFLVDITMHLNKLNLRLQGPGKTVICLFEAWKGFVAKLDVCTRGIQTATFRYFKHLKTFSVNHQVNGAEINIYMRDLTSQFRNRFQDFQRFGPLFSFLINPQGNEDMDLSAFE